jgi:hypothetical protein
MVIVRAVGLAAALACACADPGLPDGAVRAEVVALDGIDPTTGAASYSVAARELPGLVDLRAMRGTSLQLIGAPTLEFPATVGDAATVDCPPVEVTAAPLALRWTLVDDVVVPRDYDTLVALSVYHELEQVLTDATELLGWPRGALLRGEPLPVWLRPALAAGDQAQTLRSNAFYFGCLHGFGIAAPSRAEQQPIAVDRAVLSHEFGHLIWGQTFEQGDGACDPDEAAANQADPLFPGRLATEAAVRGFNEGIADLTAFAMVGATDILGQAFDGDTWVGDRALVPSVPAYQAFTFDDREACDHSFYCIGTLLARALVQAFVDGGGDLGDRAARLAFARDVWAAVARVPAGIAALGPDALPPPTAAQARCESDGDAIDDDVVVAYLRALVAGLPPGRRARACAALPLHFGATIGLALVSACEAP